MLKLLSIPFFILFGLSLAGQDFYVVDSLYCQAHDPVETPTERQYNLDFTADGEVLESRREAYLPWAGQWRNAAYLTYVYDGENNLVEQTEQRWDTLAMDWKNFKRTQNTPNANGDFTQVLNEEWDSAIWQPIDRITSVFNANGHIETLTQELWDVTVSGGWKKNFRIIYATNANGQFVQTKFQLWDAAAISFYDVSRTNFTYNAQQLESEAVTEIFNTGTQTWDKSSRSLNNYDSFGNLTERTTQLWNNVEEEWQNDNRILQNFNAAGQVTLRTELLWNGTQWVNFFQTNNVYDANGNLTRFEVSEWQISQWVLLNSCDFYVRFHHEVLAAGKVQPAFCEIPNPYTPGTVFSCDALPAGRFQLQLFDLSGKLLYTQNIENQNFIKIETLPAPGLYLLTIAGEQSRFFTQKIIIPR